MKTKTTGKQQLRQLSAVIMLAFAFLSFTAPASASSSTKLDLAEPADEPNPAPPPPVVYDATTAMRDSVVYSHEVSGGNTTIQTHPVYDATAAMLSSIVYSRQVTGRNAAAKSPLEYDATAAMQASVVYSHQVYAGIPISGHAVGSLEQAAQGLSDAFADKDYLQISAFFAEDIIAMYPLGPFPTVGNSANQEVWMQAFQVYEAHPLTVDTVVVAKSKDVGYSYGRWAASSVPDVGSSAGRYVATWINTKSGWKVTHLSAHIHTDVPPEDILED